MTARIYAGNSHAREKEILDFVNKLLDLDNLTEILEEIVQDAPRLIDAKTCIICLSPHLVKTYNGSLIDVENKEMDAWQIEEDFIVLTAANPFENCSGKIGKYFYRKEEGLIGWVFKKIQPFCWIT